MRHTTHPDLPPIETATRADLDRILRLQKTAYLSEAEIYGDDAVPPLRQTMEELEGEFGTMLFLKAETEGKLIGSVRADERGGICRIGKLMVSPEFRKRGLGAALPGSMFTHETDWKNVRKKVDRSAKAWGEDA